MRGTSEGFTRAAYVPFRNVVALVRTSVRTVLEPVPALEVSGFLTVLPPRATRVTFEGSQVAPGTPGPPESERTPQPWEDRTGSVCEAHEKPSKRVRPAGGSVGGSVGSGPGAVP